MEVGSWFGRSFGRFIFCGFSQRYCWAVILVYRFTHLTSCVLFLARRWS
jgi:hypothetical protein